MFLRRCERRKSGKRHTYWALVESSPAARGSRQRVVAYLGDLAPSEQDGWAKLGAHLQGKDSPANGASATVSRLTSDSRAQSGAAWASGGSPPKRVHPPQPFLTVGIASRVDLVHPVFKEAFHGQAGESREGTGVAGTAAAV